MSLEFRKPYTNGKPSAWVRALAGKSGVYVIKAVGMVEPVLYVGESHTGRLKKTMLRHFQRWKGETAGAGYDPAAVVVAVVRCPASAAVETQNAMIEELSPRDNVAEKPTLWKRIKKALEK
jgi:hypothetical protein